MVDSKKLRNTGTASANPFDDPASVPAVISSLPTVRPENEALALPESLMGFTGGEGLSDEDMVIPRFKIVQPTSEIGDPGKLYCNITGEQVDALNIVVIKIEKGRIYWEAGNLEAKKPLCRSNDFMNPDPSIENPFAEHCAKMVRNAKTGREQPVQVCKYGSWDGDEKPPCKVTYNLLCISLDDGLPFWISLSGAGIKPVKNYVSSIMLRKKPFFTFMTTFTTELRTEPKRHYAPKFSMPRAIDEAMYADIIPTVEALRYASIQRTFEAEESMADEGGDAYEAGGAGEGEAAADPAMPAFMKKD